MSLASLASRLFEPFELGHLRVPNRVVMAPMTRRKSPQGVPDSNVADYYARRAQGGVGLIITEGTFIDDPDSGAPWEPDVPRFYGPESLAGWRAVADKVHAAGGLIFPQLWHLGIRSNDMAPRSPVGPSGIAPDGSLVTEPMSIKRINETVEGYVRSAVHAQKLGFDGIELHAAHGYFLDQFFWDRTNKRTDKYGGSISQRTRLACEIVQEIKRQVGEDFPVCLRMSQWKLGAYEAKIAVSPKELEEWVIPLAEAGVDIFHCSTRRFWLPEFEGSELNLAGWVKKLSGKPTITVGSVSLNEEFISTFKQNQSNDEITFHDLEERLERHEFDLVAIGRALISNPDWANLVASNRVEALKPFRKEDLADLK